MSGSGIPSLYRLVYLVVFFYHINKLRKRNTCYIMSIEDFRSDFYHFQPNSDNCKIQEENLLLESINICDLGF